jgi:integrase
VRGSVRKRGDTYTVIYRASDPATGRTKQVWKGGFRTKREAEDELKEIVRQVDAGTYARPTKVTLNEFLTDQWLPAAKATIRPTTLSMYCTYIEAHIVPGIGGTQLRALAPSQLNVLYADLLDHGRRDGKGGLSNRSVRIVHVILHRALRDAQKWGLVPRNVAELADPPQDHSPEKEVWTPEQVGTFLASVEDDRLSALWRLAAATGMRRGELLGIRWSDVDLERGSVTITQNVVVVDHQPAISAPKTAAGRRTISLDPDTVAAMRRHWARQAEERLAWGPDWPDTDLCFTREDGTVLHPERITKWFEQRRKLAKLPRMSFHGLRHAHATALLRGGVPIRVVSQRLGHASVTVTLAIYAHVLPGDDEAAAMVGAQLLGATHR